MFNWKNVKNNLFEKFEKSKFPLDIMYTEKRDSVLDEISERKLAIPLYGYEDTIKRKIMKPISKILDPEFLIK